MNTNRSKYLSALELTSLLLASLLIPRASRAQVWPYGAPPPIQVPTTPSARRGALNSVRSQARWLQNATRTVSDNNGGAGLVWQQFQYLRGTYSSLTMTLTQQQQASGANELAELSAGLDILQEAFTNYQNDVASGRPSAIALNDLCEVLRQATAVWLQELNQDCARLRVGW
jgi:hypothetical protein